MWKATHHHKIPILLAQALGSLAGSDDDLEAPTDLRDGWRKVVRGGEDTLTSTVFERLAYLPGDLALRLLTQAASAWHGSPAPPEPILASEPWPQLQTKDGTRVEPDWLFETESAWWIVEAKWGCAPPDETQLRGQYEALQHTRGERLRGKPVVHITVVRSGRPWATPWPLLEVRWADLRSAVYAAMGTANGATKRILVDIVEALDARGLDRQFMATLVGLKGPKQGVFPRWGDERSAGPSGGDHVGSPLRHDTGEMATPENAVPEGRGDAVSSPGLRQPATGLDTNDRRKP